MGYLLKKSYLKSPKVDERYNIPLRQITFGQGYEQLYLEIYDLTYVKNFIDYWGFLYLGEVKESVIPNLDDIRQKVFDTEEHRERYMSKVCRQLARAPFYEELETRALYQMSPNVRWVAEMLVKSGLAELVL